jgi:hypothetical protein
LTPLSSSGGVASSWVVDRSLMHNQGGPLLLDTVELLGWFVQDCTSGEWIDINTTIYAPFGDPLTIINFNNSYDVRHGYGNIVTNQLLETRFACPHATPSYQTVLRNGEAQSVLSVGRVNYAVVVKHR